MRPGVLSVAVLAVVAILISPLGGAPDADTKKVTAKKATPTPKPKPEFPTFATVSKDYKKVVSHNAGDKPLYTVYHNKKAHQLLAEIAPGFDGKRIFIATSIAGGSRQTGWQWRERHCYWTRHDKKLVLMEPELRRRAKGGPQDAELKLAIERTYNDRVITSVPILTMGPGGGPVIDLDALLIKNAKLFTGLQGDSSLARIEHVKTFPQNIEIAVTIPMADGQMTTLHYSISVIPKTDYKPRESDDRVGYFLTVFKDLTKVSPDGRNFVRYINRWNLQKRDSSLSLSPPVRPIVFYIEHTVPVRYRRYVRQGILEWNKAFEKCGIIDAVEVRQQDAQTGAFMDLDPEDVRYNFFRWISSETPFAMGPSRVNAETGEILDADIVFDDSMLKYYALRYERLIATYGFDGIDPEAMRWIEEHPLWDPRVGHSRVDRDRRSVLADTGLSREQKAELLGMPRPPGRDELLTGVVQQNRYCSYAFGKAIQMRTAHLAARLLQGELFGETDAVETMTVDGVPEDYLGAILKEIVMHEVGHTLGLRHNFKASTWLTLDEYVHRRGDANVGSVMDYNPIFVPPDPAAPRGDWVTPTIGPYDYWAIEHGYTTDDKRREQLMKQVTDRGLQYATDNDLWGPDPLVVRFDLGADPLEWAKMRLELVKVMRGKLLDKAVKDGQSWYLLRQAYELLLSEHLGTLRVAGRYLGGVYVHRDHKGDPNARDPLVPAEPEKQRRALDFLIDNAFRDEAFDVRPEILRKLATDKYRHWGNLGSADVAFSIHDRIAQIQSFALLYLMNPGTLTRVLDNELRTSPEEDALTLAELMEKAIDAVFAELDTDRAGAKFTNRKPMTSSLRRNLQAAMTDRLIDLAINGRSAPRAAQTLALGHLWRINGKLDRVVNGADGRVDEYTLVHLSDLKERIDKAVNSVYFSGHIGSSPSHRGMSWAPHGWSEMGGSWARASGPPTSCGCACHR